MKTSTKKKVAKRAPVKAQKTQAKPGRPFAVPEAMRYTEEDLVHTSILAQICELSEHRIRSLCREPGFPEVVDNVVPFIPWMRQYVRHLRDENKRTSKTAITQRLQAAKAEEAELRVAVQKREVIPMEEAFGFASELSGFFRTSIDSIPIRATRDLEMRKVIEKECDAVLTRAADKFDKLGRAIRSGSFNSEADEEDVAGPVGSEQQAVP